MEVPTPDNIPSAKLRNYLGTLREAILTGRPIAGQKTSISENRGQGTVINALQDIPFPIPPETGTWVLGSIDGVLQWLPTEVCACS
jgi:hypothetical protein